MPPPVPGDAPAPPQLLLALLLSTAGGASGCGREKPPGADEDQTGSIRVSLTVGAAEGIGAVRFDVSQDRKIVLTSTVEIGTSSLDWRSAPILWRRSGR
jgi:hypothetical protein